MKAFVAGVAVFTAAAMAIDWTVSGISFSQRLGVMVIMILACRINDVLDEAL